MIDCRVWAFRHGLSPQSNGLCRAEPSCSCSYTPPLRIQAAPSAAAKVGRRHISASFDLLIALRAPYVLILLPYLLMSGETLRRV